MLIAVDLVGVQLAHQYLAHLRIEKYFQELM